jgi:radical SAM superfamily enzyme YgiQ (UPF0313 family)
MRILLLSTYELGHQPLALARPAAHLLQAGHEVRCLDLAVEQLDQAVVRWAELIGISVPMHTATRLGVELGRRLRDVNSTAHFVFYGLYAGLHAELLLDGLADSVIGGEYERPLVELANRLDGRAEADSPVDGVIDATGGATFLGRQPLLLPRRDLLPPLDRYVRLEDGRRRRLTGYLEASRGCAHRCLHCPITPVYAGRLRIVPEEIVLEDIRALVALGAEHITFGDPDFFNGVKHSMRIVERLHAEHPDVGYDATIKVEHLLEHAALLPVLARTGCRFVVSAVEAVDDLVLTNLDKGHTAADVLTALELTRSAGLSLRPTLLPFTPWLRLEGFLDLLDFVEQHELAWQIDPIQYSIRLLVPRGSSLLASPALQPYLGDFDPSSLSHRWEHPDQRMDRLQQEVVAEVERQLERAASAPAILARLRSLALEAAGAPTAGAGAPMTALAMAGGGGPRLSEPWFC